MNWKCKILLKWWKICWRKSSCSCSFPLPFILGACFNNFVKPNQSNSVCVCVCVRERKYISLWIRFPLNIAFQITPITKLEQHVSWNQFIICILYSHKRSFFFSTVMREVLWKPALRSLNSRTFLWLIFQLVLFCKAPHNSKVLSLPEVSAF